MSELVCKQERLARISCREAVADSKLAFAADISVSGVEIVEARVDKRVYHFVEFIVVDLVALHRKAHASEAEVFLDLGKAHCVFSFNLSFFLKYA